MILSDLYCFTYPVVLEPFTVGHIGIKEKVLPNCFDKIKNVHIKRFIHSNVVVWFYLKQNCGIE